MSIQTNYWRDQRLFCPPPLLNYWGGGSWPLLPPSYAYVLHILDISAVSCMVSEKIFKVLSQYKSMQILDSLGVASMNPRGSIGRINVGDNWNSIHTKYISCGPRGVREGDWLKFFPSKCLWELYVTMASRVPIQST